MRTKLCRDEKEHRQLQKWASELGITPVSSLESLEATAECQGEYEYDEEYEASECGRDIKNSDFELGGKDGNGDEEGFGLSRSDLETEAESPAPSLTPSGSTSTSTTTSPTPSASPIGGEVVDT